MQLARVCQLHPGETGRNLEAQNDFETAFFDFDLLEEHFGHLAFIIFGFESVDHLIVQ